MTCEMKELGVLKISAPCPADWDAMKGDEQVRRCERCALNVYNLSALTADEARALIKAREGQRLCVRFYERDDGTVLTRDCPRGLTARARWRMARNVSGGLLGFLATVALFVTMLFGDSLRRLRAEAPFGVSEGPRAPAPKAKKLTMGFASNSSGY